jgi:hypothetical protein
MDEQNRMPLVEAAKVLSVGYYVAHNWALTRVLDSERVNGRWFVDRRSVERLQRERAAGKEKDATSQRTAR